MYFRGPESHRDPFEEELEISRMVKNELVEVLEFILESEAFEPQSVFTDVGRQGELTAPPILIGASVEFREARRAAPEEAIQKLREKVERINKKISNKIEENFQDGARLVTISGKQGIELVYSSGSKESGEESKSKESNWFGSISSFLSNLPVPLKHPLWWLRRPARRARRARAFGYQSLEHMDKAIEKEVEMGQKQILMLAAKESQLDEIAEAFVNSVDNLLEIFIETMSSNWNFRFVTYPLYRVQEEGERKFLGNTAASFTVETDRSFSQDEEEAEQFREKLCKATSEFNFLSVGAGSEPNYYHQKFEPSLGSLKILLDDSLLSPIELKDIAKDVTAVEGKY